MSWTPCTGRPPAVTSTSPRKSPATAAGLPGTTSTRRSPRRWPRRAASGGGSGTGMPATPSQARRTRPVDISSDTMCRVLALIGTARPSPKPATAVLTPTTRPAESASAPPELPGFSAASVWITSSMRRTCRPSRTGNDRPSALTTPAVTEPARPIGLPTAMTSWPMRRLSASPRVAGGTLVPDTRRTARSASGSAPTTSKRTWSPVVNSAVPPSAYATTWALVSTNPSTVNTTPEPAPSPRRLRTLRLATVGRTDAATLDTTWLYASMAAVSRSGSMSVANAR